MKIRIDVNEFPTELEIDDASVEVRQDSYGWTLRPNHGEWEMTVKLTSRQDGNTAWGAVLAEVDGNVTAITGLAPWSDAGKDIIQALNTMTMHWITPIGG